MKFRQLVIVFLILLIVLPVFLNRRILQGGKAQTTPDVYVGIDVAYESIDATKHLVDKVCNYTNLLVIGCTGITYNDTKLSEVCEYLYARNMFFIVYTDVSRWPSQQWLLTAKTQWADKFLGLYAYDEIGGKQLDQATNGHTFQTADNCTDARNKFIAMYDQGLNRFSTNSGMPLYTSDYALYYFDYLAGYDTVFAEFGWNYSRQLNVALCRGAATALNKDWGVTITWTYTQPPYIESGADLYNDLVLAYNNGAKYITIFDSNEDYSGSILSREHFYALQMFWEYMKTHPRGDNPSSDRVAYALPVDYGYGFRGPRDSVWGVWQADDISYALSVSFSILLTLYGTKLDVIYEDTLQSGDTFGYSKIISWDDHDLFADWWPEITPSPSPSPTLTPTPSPSPSPSPSPTTSTPSPTETPTPSPSPTQQPLTPTPTPTSTKDPNVLAQINYVYPVTAVAVAVGIIAAVLLFKKTR
jgi:hypothetical protein